LALAAISSAVGRSAFFPLTQFHLSADLLKRRNDASVAAAVELAAISFDEQRGHREFAGGAAAIAHGVRRVVEAIWRPARVVRVAMHHEIYHAEHAGVQRDRTAGAL
jgi:hypothetical protein